MWIERLEFIGFGNLTGQAIDFGRNKVSVIIQPNEYGKSTISDAIWATLFDYPERNSDDTNLDPDRKPHSGAAFKACLDLTIDERRIRLFRSFTDRSLKILDLTKDPAKATADITQEYADLLVGESFGKAATGLTRELFRTVCLIEQRQLQRQVLSGKRSLSTWLFNVADSDGASGNVFEAVSALESALECFSHNGHTLRLEVAVKMLRAEKQSILERLAQLKDSRERCDHDVLRLSGLDERLDLIVKSVASAEYVLMRSDYADVVSRSNRAKEKLANVQRLRVDAEQLGVYKDFPILHQVELQELWAKRQARVADLARFANELAAKDSEIQASEVEFLDRGQVLTEFTIEDAQILAGLAHTFQTVFSEIEESRIRRQAERRRVRSAGIDLDSLATVRDTLLTFEPRALDDAYATHALFAAARDRAAECERNAENARLQLREIYERFHIAKSNLSRAYWICIAINASLLVPLAYLIRAASLDMSEWPVVLLSVLWWVTLLSAATLFAISKNNSIFQRKNEENRARSDELKQQNAANEMWSKAASLETRIEDFARKCGLSSAAELIQYMQEYTASATQLKELDMLDHMLVHRDVYLQNLRKQLVQYFERAQLHVYDVTPEAALNLSEDIHRFLEHRRHSRSSVDLLSHRESEMRFLSDELKDLESILQNHFVIAGLTFGTIEDGHRKFTQAVDSYRSLESVQNELDRIESDTTSDLPLNGLADVVSRLQVRQAAILPQLEALALTIPDLPSVNQSALPSSESINELAELKTSLETLKQERQELAIQIRSTTQCCQDNYVKELEALETTESQLLHARNLLGSLTLAKQTFLELADENHSVWADKLNEIATEMLKPLGTDYENFEFSADLGITVRRKGQREVLSTGRDQLSVGAREQLHWLARMAVVRYLSQSRVLPVILDEPFSETDDDRFLKMMRFLITNISPSNQIIIFSCHQQRHEWLLEQLDAKEKQSIEFCRLVPLHSDASAFVRR